MLFKKFRSNLKDTHTDKDKSQFQYVYLLTLIPVVLTFITFLFMGNSINKLSFDLTINDYVLVNVKNLTLSNMLFGTAYGIALFTFLLVFVISDIVLVVLESLFYKLRQKLCYKMIIFANDMFVSALFVTSILLYDFLYLRSFLDASSLVSANAFNYISGILLVIYIVFAIFVFVFKYDTFNTKNKEYPPLLSVKDQMSQEEKDSLEYVDFVNKDQSLLTKSKDTTTSSNITDNNISNSNDDSFDLIINNDDDNNK